MQDWRSCVRRVARALRIPRSARVLAALGAGCLAVAPSPAAAQQRAVPVTVAACPVADTLFGALARDLGTVTGVVADSPGVTTLAVGPRPGTSFSPDAKGIVQVGAATMFEGRRPSSLPPFTFDLKVIDPAPREIEARQLTLVLDGTDTVRVGSMQGRVQHWPGTSAAVQNMVAVLTANAFYRLSRSSTAEVDLSGTRHAIPAETLRDFRTLYVAALCGVGP